MPTSKRTPEASWGAGHRVVVTGGAGFLGSWTCERLLADGAEVVAVDSLLTGRRDNLTHLAGDPRFTLLEQDISDDLDVTGRAWRDGRTGQG